MTRNEAVTCEESDIQSRRALRSHSILNHGNDATLLMLLGELEARCQDQREAKLLASLNHPNIAAIYGLEEHEGSRFLVPELVEGETLSDRLKRGAIPVEESLKLAADR